MKHHGICTRSVEIQWYSGGHYFIQVASTMFSFPFYSRLIHCHLISVIDLIHIQFTWPTAGETLWRSCIGILRRKRVHEIVNHIILKNIGDSIYSQPVYWLYLIMQTLLDDEWKHICKYFAGSTCHENGVTKTVLIVRRTESKTANEGYPRPASYKLVLAKSPYFHPCAWYYISTDRLILQKVLLTKCG